MVREVEERGPGALLADAGTALVAVYRVTRERLDEVVLVGVVLADGPDAECRLARIVELAGDRLKILVDGNHDPLDVQHRARGEQPKDVVALQAGIPSVRVGRLDVLAELPEDLGLRARAVRLVDRPPQLLAPVALGVRQAQQHLGRLELDDDIPKLAVERVSGAAVIGAGGEHAAAEVEGPLRPLGRAPQKDVSVHEDQSLVHR